MHARFSRRFLAAVLSVAVCAGCAGPVQQAEDGAAGPEAPETALAPEAGTPAELRSELDRLAAETDVVFSLAVTDHASGRTWSYRGGERYLEASLVKVPILLTLLRVQTEQGTGPGDEERSLAEAMIRRSDNDATDCLYEQIGGADELRRTYELLGVEQTQAADIWGANETVAEDQVRIATALAGGVDWIRDDLMAWAVDLVETIDPGQRWGITAGSAGAADEVGLKNGWLQDDALAWNVGSAGFVLAGDAGYSVAVLTAGAAELEEGIGVVERAAAVVNRWQLGS